MIIKSTDRAPRIDKFNFSDKSDTYDFVMKGDKLSLTFNPALGSSYPDRMEVEHPCPARMEQPTKTPIQSATRGIFEVQGRKYYSIVAHFDWPVVSGTGDQIPVVGYALDFLTGKELCRLEVLGQRESSDIIAGLAAKLLNEKNGKALGAGTLKTKIHDLDLENMTQTYSASIEAAGIPAYVVTGHVSDLRKAGKNPDSFKFFETAQVFTDGTFAHVIAKDWTGTYHTVTSTPTEQIQVVQAKTFDAAYLTISNLTQHLQNRWI